MCEISVKHLLFPRWYHLWTMSMWTWCRWRTATVDQDWKMRRLWPWNLWRSWCSVTKTRKSCTKSMPSKSWSTFESTFPINQLWWTLTCQRRPSLPFVVTFMASFTTWWTSLSWMDYPPSPIRTCSMVTLSTEVHSVSNAFSSSLALSCSFPTTFSWPEATTRVRIWTRYYT